MDADEINAYFEGLLRLGRECATRGDGALYECLDSLIAQGDATAMSLLALRSELLSASDLFSVQGLLPIGLFRGLTGGRTRSAAFRMALDLENLISEKHLRQRFALYREDQPLFTAFPSYLALASKSELLPINVAHEWRDDGVFRSATRFLRLDPFLKPVVVTWLRDHLDEKPILRVDPEFVHVKEPPRLLVESVLVPADPTWWPNLNVYRGMREGSTYRLDPPADPATDMEAWWEYHIGGLRRLETSARGGRDGYLSVMVEELANLRDVAGFMVGRMIHCDLVAASDENATNESISLGHLDLAINIYDAARARERMDQELHNGTVCDATFRTHLIKVHGGTLDAVLPLAQLFLGSRSLVSDWFNDQFGSQIAGLQGAPPTPVTK